MSPMLRTALFCGLLSLPYPFLAARSNESRLDQAQPQPLLTGQMLGAANQANARAPEKLTGHTPLHEVQSFGGLGRNQPRLNSGSNPCAQNIPGQNAPGSCDI